MGEKISQLESTQELNLKELPVLIHRWFSDGDGWAYNPSLSNNFASIVHALDSVLKYGKMGDSKIKISENEWVVCTKRPDNTTKDEKAKNRSPFYLTAALFSGPEPIDEELEEIYRQLKILPEVEQKGSSESLSIGGKSKKEQ